MAPKTGSSGLVALFLLLNITFASALNSMTADAKGYKKTTMAHTGTVATKPTGVPVANTTTGGTTGTANTTTPALALNATVLNCFLQLPNNVLTAEGLATPFQLMAPCSQTVSTQQSFAEAAVFDPATGDISIYHPLVIDQGKTPQVAPVVPALPAGAIVALWFGFNGGVLQLLDVNGLDTNMSPTLKGIDCVNGLPGTDGDVFGQPSWCNTPSFFNAVNPSVAAGKTVVPPLGTDINGQDCPSSRSFKIVDACPSDNLPTQYLLLADNTTIQDTATNRNNFPDATILDNASDEALIGEFIDPVIKCTPFQVPSLDNPGVMVASLATQEIQAGVFQQAPVARVALNDPDCLLTANGDTSTSKTNAYRLGVNQGLLGNGPNTDNGSLIPYCEGMISIAPAFFQLNMAGFSGATTPAAGVGNNLFTFLCARYLQSLMLLGCPEKAVGVSCTFDGNGAATACTITPTNSTIPATGTNSTAGMGAAGASTGTGGGKASATTLATATTAAGGGKGGAAAPTGGLTGGVGGGSGAAVVQNATVPATCTCAGMICPSAPAASIKARDVDVPQFGRRNARRTRIRSEHAW